MRRVDPRSRAANPLLIMLWRRPREDRGAWTDELLNTEFT
jgi:hypothetical protein